MTSASEDVLKMPAIEALKVSSTTPNPKAYHKINSDPALFANRNKSNSGNSTRENSGSAKNNVKRVLHTIEQPDGSVIGYCTEHPVDEPEKKE